MSNSRPYNFIVTYRRMPSAEHPYSQFYVKVFTNVDKASAFSEQHGGTKPLAVPKAATTREDFTPIAATLVRMAMYHFDQTEGEQP